MTKNKLRAMIAGSLLLSLSGVLLFSPADSITRIQVNTDQAQTLTGPKTLIEPIIATIRNTGLLTLPTSTDTLVGRATTDTFTNKTLTSPTIVTPAITSNTTVTGSAAPFVAINTTSSSNAFAWMIFLKNNATKWFISSDPNQTNAQEFAISDGSAGIRLLIDANGVLDVRQGQIKFPGTCVASTDASTLDCYKENTWSPSVGGTATYTVQSGTYVKIGKLVYVQGEMTINALGTGSTSQITNLPFSTPFAAGNDAALTISASSGLAVSPVSLSLFVSNNSTIAEVVGRTGAAASSGTLAVFGNGAGVVFSGFYHATS